MESSRACNLKEVGSEAAIAAPIIKLLWSPVREEHRGGGGEGGVMSERVGDRAAALVLKVVGAHGALNTSAEAKTPTKQRNAEESSTRSQCTKAASSRSS